MSYEMVNEYYKKLERILRTQYGARGRTFGVLLQSVEPKLPRLVVVGLHEVQRVRNKLAHVLEFGPNSVPLGFDELCKEIIIHLSTAESDARPIVRGSASLQDCCQKLLNDDVSIVVRCGICGSIHRARRTNRLEPLRSSTTITSKMVEVKIEDIGNYVNVPVVEVLVKTGDKVAKDDGLVVLESDKATMELPSPVAGVVRSLRTKVGDKVSQGSLILMIEVE